MQNSTMVPIFDPYEQYIESAIQAAIKKGELETASVQAIAMRIRAADHTGKEITYDKSDAADFLKGTLNSFVAMVRQFITQSYGPSKWLWYLRRTPRVIFEEGIESTLYERLCIAEIFIEQSDGKYGELSQSEEGTPGDLRFRVDAGTIKNLLLLSQFAREVHQILVCIRYCAKGASLKVSSDGNFELKKTEELEQAVNLFDQRCIQSPASGFFPTFPDYRTSTDSGKSCLMVECVPVKWKTQYDVLKRASVTEPPPSQHCRSILTKYSIGKTGLADIVRVLEHASLPDCQRWHEDIPVLFAFHNLMEFLLGCSAERLPEVFFGVVQRGYYVIEKAALEGDYDKFSEEITAWCTKEIPRFADQIPPSGSELVGKLYAMQSSLELQLPAAGVLDAGRGILCLDLVASTQRFMGLIKYPVSGGKSGELQGQEFEHSVQRIIDGSSWCPENAEIRSLRELDSLKLNGQRITDIDAIGMQGKKILLAECKSYQYSIEYAAGVHSVIQAVRSKLEGDQAKGGIGDILKWKDKLKTIRDNPIGDNYDLSGYEIIGVIVTPNLFFVPLDLAELPSAPGLRFYSSATELSQWLDGDSKKSPS